ncbi:MAG: phosphatase PAP2 family protein [Acidobacteriota bacterium]
MFALGLTAVLGLLATLAAVGPPGAWEVQLARLIQDRVGASEAAILRALSWTGDFPHPWILGTAACLVLLLVRGRRDAGVLAAALSSGGLLTMLIKVWTGRPRPQEPMVRVLEAYPHNSFPSGHVVFLTILAGFFLLELRRPKGPAGVATRLALLSIFAGLVGTSRVYLGAHWPLDVAGGVVLAGLILVAVDYLLHERPSGMRAPTR